jgi:hypothetical protein
MTCSNVVCVGPASMTQRLVIGLNSRGTCLQQAWRHACCKPGSKKEVASWNQPGPVANVHTADDAKSSCSPYMQHIGVKVTPTSLSSSGDHDPAEWTRHTRHAFRDAQPSEAACVSFSSACSTPESNAAPSRSPGARTFCRGATCASRDTVCHARAGGVGAHEVPSAGLELNPSWSRARKRMIGAIGRKKSLAPDCNPASQADFERLVSFLCGHKNMLVITGAGCSTESDIPGTPHSQRRARMPRRVEAAWERLNHGLDESRHAILTSMLPRPHQSV